MRILISGASGFIGGRLSSYLSSLGFEVVRIVRAFSYKDIYLNFEDFPADLTPLEGFSACLHFAGENIAERWTKEKKERIRKSRVETTKYLSHLFTRLKHPPKIFITASGIGFYGDRGEDILSEDEPPGEGFLASVCQEWEQASKKAEEMGIRVVHMRQGVVLGKDGGMLKKLLLPYHLGLGGMLGTGKQYLSWIHIHDLERAVAFLLQNSLSGPINCCSPEPVKQKEFALALSKTVHRPAFLPLPAPLIKLMLGEMGKEMLLYSARAYPNALLSKGFSFKYPGLDSALADLLKNP